MPLHTEEMASEVMANGDGPSAKELENKDEKQAFSEFRRESETNAERDKTWLEFCW